MDWYKPQTFETTVQNLLYTPLDGEPSQVEKLQFLTEGPRGDYHNGMHTLSTVREMKFVEKGSYVLNTRQATITSSGESETVAQALGVSNIRPEDLMSNIHLEGIPFLSGIPAGSHVLFFDPLKREQRQLVLFITGVNDPCHIPKDRISERLEIEIRGYEKEAYNRRGLLSMVYRPGFAKIGDLVRIHTPRIAYQDQLR